MTLKIRKALIVFCSPAGSTAHVARLMKQKIQSLEIPVTMLDLGDDPDIAFIIPQLFDAKDNVCLYIGSPVYASHPVPPVMEFIARLPPAGNGYGIPFVTWGGVTSGIALLEMAAVLENKGYRVLGAAKVMAKHSLMWQTGNALGEGHPDADDDRMIEALLEKINDKLKSTNPSALNLSVLDYQTAENRAAMQARSFEAAKAHFPQKRVIEDLCTHCGVCADQCPVDAVTLSAYPEFGPTCMGCFTCLRLCPEAAIVADFKALHARIRARAQDINERPFTQIFI
jgi:Pyruvate/2-oxoacid:ferredoxin oxidoreductase delta subunit/flavodoxin